MITKVNTLKINYWNEAKYLKYTNMMIMLHFIHFDSCIVQADDVFQHFRDILLSNLMWFL
jgi:hypothetical protein